jgi:hypothetical protein
MICKTTVDDEQLPDRTLRAPHLWIIDTGASHHMSFERSLFRTFEDYHVPIQAGMSTTTSQGRSQVDLDVDGHLLSLYGVPISICYRPNVHAKRVSLAITAFRTFSIAAKTRTQSSKQIHPQAFPSSTPIRLYPEGSYLLPWGHHTPDISRPSPPTTRPYWRISR